MTSTENSTPEKNDEKSPVSGQEESPTISSTEGSPTTHMENFDKYFHVEIEDENRVIAKFTPLQFSYIVDLINKSNHRREYMRVKNRERYARLKAEGKLPSQNKPPQDKEKRGRKPIDPIISDPQKLLVRVVSKE